MVNLHISREACEKAARSRATAESILSAEKRKKTIRDKEKEYCQCGGTQKKGSVFCAGCYNALVKENEAKLALKGIYGISKRGHD